MESREGMSLADYRKAIGKPNPSELQRCMGNIALIKQKFNKRLLSKREVIIDGKLGLKEIVAKEEDPAYAARWVCSVTVLDVLEEVENEAINAALSSSDDPMVRFHTDIVKGAEVVLNFLLTTEDKKLESADEYMLEFAKRQEDDEEQSLWQDVEIYCKLRKYIKDCGEHLNRDSRGFSLIDKMIGDLEIERLELEEYRSKDYVIAGARLAKDLYIEIYKDQFLC